jgi:tripartite-type tricarboxylate transporter receptor subunit TctC
LAWAGISILVANLGASPAAATDDLAEFFKGRQIRLVIGTNAGGAYDLYARTVARHLGKHIPGNPVFIPQNMAGAGGRTAANWLYSVAPKDDSVIGTISQSAPLDQLRKQNGIRFDVVKFGWIGNPVIDNLITVSWKDSGLATIADVRERNGLICGGSGASTPSILTPQILNNLLATKIRIVAGYAGILQVSLAMQQGEVNCMGGNSWSSLWSGMSDLMKARKLNMLVQWGLEKNPEISAYQRRDVPLVAEFAENDIDRKVLNLINSGVAVGRPLLAPPTVPIVRLEALRRGFDATMKDPEFLADAGRQSLEISPVPGEKLQQIVTEVANTRDDILARANELMTLIDVTGSKAND